MFVAHDSKLDRRVALKLPRQDVSASVDRLALFRREARAAAALNHPGIVHIYSVEDADGLTFITMELVSGRSLRELLNAQSPLAIPKTLAIAVGIAEGLASAHAAGVLHRDLKPANVMITDDERVKILDFGVAKFFRPADCGTRKAPRRRPSSPTTASPSARSVTCRPSRRSASRSTRAVTCSRWESCCSRWLPGDLRLQAAHRRRYSISS